MSLHPAPTAPSGDPLHERLARARGFARLTQEELADRVGISSRTIRHWEKGRHSPTFEAVILIAKATGLPFSFFVDGLPDVTVEYRHAA